MHSKLKNSTLNNPIIIWKNNIIKQTNVDQYTLLDLYQFTRRAWQVSSWYITSNPSSNFWLGPRFLFICFVFFLWSFDFEPLWLSPHFICLCYLIRVREINYISCQNYEIVQILHWTHASLRVTTCVFYSLTLFFTINDNPAIRRNQLAVSTLKYNS